MVYKKRKMHKRNYEQRPSDNWGTPKKAYILLKEHVLYFKNNILKKNRVVIWDPFYYEFGNAKEYMDEVFGDFADIIHKNDWIELDKPIPEYAKDVDLIITNPPFSSNNKLLTTLFLMNSNKPFITLMPTEFMMVKKFRPYVDKFQFIMPNGRVRYEKNGKNKNAEPMSSCFYCYNLSLENKIYFCE